MKMLLRLLVIHVDSDISSAHRHLQVIADAQSHVEISIYPYYNYYDDSTTYPLDFALGKPTSKTTVQDGPHGYTSLFDAMYDAARVALDRYVNGHPKSWLGLMPRGI